MTDIEPRPEPAAAVHHTSPAARLAELEAVIEEGVRAFVAAGRALRQIRDERLYLTFGYESFSAYVSERWSRRHAYRMIESAEVVEVAGDVAGVIETESQARELVPLVRHHPTPSDAVQRVLRVVEDTTSKTTAAAIRDAVQAELSLASEPPEEPQSDITQNVHFSRAEDEWRTPADILRRVEMALGSAIDLDPAADDERSVPAANHYTRAEDGLSREWRGRVYMNPPYGVVIGEWVQKLLDEYRAGRVGAAVVLLPARTDTGWFVELRDYPRCFLRGRLRFAGAANSAPFPSSVFYLGADAAAFGRAFADVGDIYGLSNGEGVDSKPVAPAPPPTNELSLPDGLAADEATEVLRRYADLRREHGEDVSPVRMERTLGRRVGRMRRQRESDARREALAAASGGDDRVGDVELHHADFRSLDIADGSVDLIFTDPPYARESLPLFEALGEFAARVLSPAGYLACYTGSYHELHAAARVSEHVEWWWRCVIPLRERQAAYGRGFLIDHKSLHIFRRSPEPVRGRVLPSILPTRPGAEKDHHVWGQAMGEAEWVIENLTKPGDLVVEPFLGGGTTAVAAYRLGRRCVAAEVDAATYAVALDRLRAEGEGG